MRGSLLNMMVSTASKSVFVLVKKKMRNRADIYYSGRPPSKRLRFYEEYLERLAGMFKEIMSIEVWDEEDVDKLWEQTMKSETEGRLKTDGQKELFRLWLDTTGGRLLPSLRVRTGQEREGG